MMRFPGICLIIMIYVPQEVIYSTWSALFSSLEHNSTGRGNVTFAWSFLVHKVLNTVERNNDIGL